MNLFSRVLALFGVGGLANTDKGQQYSGPATRSTEAGIVVSDDRAMQVSAVWSCVKLITETTSSLPLHFFERRSDGEREMLEQDHYLVQLLKWKPNPWMTAIEFREAMTAQLVLWGNGYALIERIDGRPSSLIPMKPEHVVPVRDETGIRYHYTTSKGVVILAADSVFHLKGFGTEGIVGLSPLAYARSVLGITVAADRYASKSFSEGGRPAGVLRVDKFLTDDQRQKMKEIYGKVSDTEVSRLMVLEGGLEFQAISMPPDDMQMLGSRQFQLAEIARFFRVPLHLIMDTEKSTTWGTGIEQLNLGFLQYTLKPYLTRWESVISDKLVRVVDRNRIFAEHQVEGLLRADAKTRAQFYSTMAQNGIMSRNEIRRKENLPRVEGADGLTVQTNLAGIEDLEAINA